MLNVVAAARIAMCPTIQIEQRGMGDNSSKEKVDEFEEEVEDVTISGMV